MNFYKILWVSYKMETQEIIKLLNDSSNGESKFATKKWYVIDSQTAKGKYKPGDTIKFETETIKSSLCDYSDGFNLVTRNITVAANNDTDVAFKNCAPFYMYKKNYCCICWRRKPYLHCNNAYVQFDWI